MILGHTRCIVLVLFDSSGEISPWWANGAILLVPLTSEAFNENGIALKQFNIVHYRKDLKIITVCIA